MATAWGYGEFAQLAQSGWLGIPTVGVRLYKSMSNVITPAEGAVLAESQWPGYHGINLPAYTESGTNTLPQITFTYPEVTWTVGPLTASENIVGWGLWDSRGVVYLQELTSPIAVNVQGQVIGLQVTVLLNGN